MIDQHIVELREVRLKFDEFVIKSLQESDSIYPQSIVFSHNYKKTYHFLLQNRTRLDISRVYVLQAFADLQYPKIMHTSSRIYVDNPYAYDPYNNAFKFGQWTRKNIWNHFYEGCDYRILYCNGTTVPKEAITPTREQSTPKVIKRIL